LMAGFMLDLGLAAGGTPLPASERGLALLLAGGPALHLAVDFLGIAITGGLLVVPAFAAAQAWSAAGERARMIGGINVVSSALMVLGALIVAALQAAGVDAPDLFLILARAGAAAGLPALRFLPMSPLRDFLALLFRLLYRLEVKGAENLDKAGGRAILALNHVSFLDGAIALSILDREPVFAIDDG